MRKPFKEDYKPDYQKWENIWRSEGKVGIFKSTIIVYCAMIILIRLPYIAYIYFFEPYTWGEFGVSDVFFSFTFFVGTILAGFILGVTNFFGEKVDYYMRQAEQEANKRYEQDLDRYYFYQNAEDEEFERKTTRELKRKRAIGEVDNERLLYLYGNMASIQNRSNERVYQLYENALNSLNHNDLNNLERQLDALEKALME